MHYQDFLAHIKTIDELREAKKIAVAVSGGLDSMCLIACMVKFCKELKVSALIVDHSLRLESAEEARGVADYLTARGVSSTILKWEFADFVQVSHNTHHQAREARYRLLSEHCKQNDIGIMLTGHNKDDQAETVIMRLMRGTGVDGLAGIPQAAAVAGVKVIRPLLKFTRSEIREIFSSLPGWNYFIEDPSNMNMKYERAKVRAALSAFPAKAELTDRLNLLAKNAARVRSFLDKVTEQEFQRLCIFNALGFITLDITSFLLLDEEIALRLLVKILKIVSGSGYPPRLHSLEILYEKIKALGLKAGKWQRRTLWGCSISFAYGSLAMEVHAGSGRIGDILLFTRELRSIKTEVFPLKVGENMWDSRFIINLSHMEKCELQVRSLKSAELIEMKRREDKYQVQKLPSPLYEVVLTLPHIFYHEKLVWSPLIRALERDEMSNFISRHVAVYHKYQKE